MITSGGPQFDGVRWTRSVAITVPGGSRPGRGQGPGDAHAVPAPPRPLFERAARLYRSLGDVSGEAEALFWVGCCHQVIRRDNAAAVPLLERSLELAARAGDADTMAEALRHLGIAVHRTGNLDEARRRLEEATRLRRQTGRLRERSRRAGAGTHGPFHIKIFARCGAAGVPPALAG
jgi:hypothetical protein